MDPWLRSDPRDEVGEEKGGCFPERNHIRNGGNLIGGIRFQKRMVGNNMKQWIFHFCTLYKYIALVHLDSFGNKLVWCP